MHEILEEQYDMIVETLSSYHAYSAKIIKRIVLRAPGKTNREENNLFKKDLFEKPGVAALSFFFKSIINWHHITDEMKQLIDQTLSDDERSNPFSDIILSKCPNEALADKIVHDLPNVSFVQIAKLHKLKKTLPRWLNLRLVITGILTVGMFFLKAVPDSLFKILEPDNLNPEIQSIGGLAGLYELLVFAYTVLAILFIVAMWSLYCSKAVKHRRACERFISYALDYFALRAEMHAAQPNATADVSGPSGPDPTSN